MTTKQYILTILIGLALINCARKPIYTCGLMSNLLKPTIDSKISKLERVAIADTTISFISGTILSGDSSEKGLVLDTLMFANVCLVDRKNHRIIGKTTDVKGQFNFSFPSSTYDLKVQFIAYKTLIIRDVKFGTGDIVNFNAILGQANLGQDSTVFQMLSNWTFKEINPKKRN